MRDSLYDDTLTRIALPVVARTANAAVNGTTVDKNVFNNQFRVCMFTVVTGTITDGTVAYTIEDSDNGSAWAAADSSYIQGTLPSTTATDDDKTFDVGYAGPKRYVRIVATQAAATTGGITGAIAVLSSPRRTPIARS